MASKTGKDSKSTIAPPEFRDWPGVKKMFRIDVPPHDLGFTILGKTPREKAEEIYDFVNKKFQPVPLDSSTFRSIANLAVLANILGKKPEFVRLTGMKDMRGRGFFISGNVISLLGGYGDENSAREFIRNYRFDDLVPLDKNIENTFIACIGAWMLGEFGVVEKIRTLAMNNPLENLSNSTVLHGLLALIQGDGREVETRLRELEVQLGVLMPPIYPGGQGIMLPGFPETIMAGVFLALAGGLTPCIFAPQSKSK